MDAFFETGRAADLILAVLAAEAMYLRFIRRRTLKAALAIVLPGICFALALRAALVGAAWPLIAVWLAAALPAHLFDLRNRSRA